MKTYISNSYGATLCEVIKPDWRLGLFLEDDNTAHWHFICIKPRLFATGSALPRWFAERLLKFLSRFSA